MFPLEILKMSTYDVIWCNLIAKNLGKTRISLWSTKKEKFNDLFKLSKKTYQT